MENCFLPKKGGPHTPAQFRPIAVGAVVYRAWAAARTAQYAAHFLSFFFPLQGSGKGTPDCGAMALHMQRLQESTHDFGAALAKAFDSVHTSLAVEILRLHGLPVSLCSCLRAAWNGQQRFPVLQGCATNSVACQVLPQGDPWSPWVLSVCS